MNCALYVIPLHLFQIVVRRMKASTRDEIFKNVQRNKFITPYFIGLYSCRKTCISLAEHNRNQQILIAVVILTAKFISDYIRPTNTGSIITF